MFRKILLVMGIAVCSYGANAHYNANMKGVIENVLVYTDGDYVYIQLKNQPTTHPTCRPNYFVIDASLPHERRQMLLTRLMTAYTTKENVNIGYDAEGDCAHGYIRIHRVG